MPDPMADLSGDLPNLTDRVAEFIVRAAGERPAPEVTQAAQRGVLDWFGTAIAGSRQAPALILADLDHLLGGNQHATLVGGPVRTSLVQAALVNGTAGHALDYDDTHLGSAVHATAAVLPAALAVAEWRGATGLELLAAYAIGFEVATYLGQVVWPSHWEAPWHATAVQGTLGAAAATSVLLRLDRRRTTEALGVAATQASGLRRMFGSMSKPLHAGKAAANGVLAGLLGERRFTSGEGALEGPQGYLTLLTGHQPPDNRIVGTAPLGEPYRILSNDFKLHACCHATHAAVDTALALRREHSLAADDVERVEVLCCPAVFAVAAKSAPRTGLEGKFSLSYCIATVLTAGDASVGQFTDDRVGDAARRSLAGRVSLVAEPSFQITRARVSVHTRSGAVLVGETEAPRGSAGNPASWDELAAKFRSLAGEVLTPEATEQLERTVRDLPNLPSCAELLRLAGQSAQAPEREAVPTG